jgi:hypothetical protein
MDIKQGDLIHLVGSVKNKLMEVIETPLGQYVLYVHYSSSGIYRWATFASINEVDMVISRKNKHKVIEDDPTLVLHLQYEYLIKCINIHKYWGYPVGRYYTKDRREEYNAK